MKQKLKDIQDLLKRPGYAYIFTVGLPLLIFNAIFRRISVIKLLVSKSVAN